MKEKIHSVPLLLFCTLLTVCSEPVAQVDPDFGPIKATAKPTINVDGYKEPRLLESVATSSWEDSIHISRDGLHLYAFYAPVDLFRYIEYLSRQDGCAPVSELQQYLRGPTLTMDLETNQYGCPMLIHSDIVHATRATVDDEFGAWQVLPFSEPGIFEAGISIIENDDSTVDILYSYSTDNNGDDIAWARATTHDAQGAEFNPIPFNSSRQEGNPFIERIDKDTLIFLYDDHFGAQNDTSIWFSASTDNGARWSEPTRLSETINKGSEVLHGHLWSDGTDWWMYFASDRNAPGLAIYRSKYLGNDLVANFDNWSEPERVISLGSIGSGTGDFVGLGEPTLTTNGDISFAVVYCAKQPSVYSFCDIDPWILEKE